MTSENRRANIADEMGASSRARAAALRNAAAGDAGTAVNRLYFAALHAVKAVCLTEGLEPRTHRGLKSLFSLHFVKSGRLPEWTVTILAQLETDRDLADYVATFTMSEDGYKERRDQAEELLAELEGYLKDQGWL